MRFPEYETLTFTLIQNHRQKYAVMCVPCPLGMEHPQVVDRGNVICEAALRSSFHAYNPVMRVGNSGWTSLPPRYRICRVRAVK
jgi:hypothetical protein